MLPIVEVGKSDKETLNNLFDAYFKLRKELEWLLHNLDDNNILEIDAAKIKNLQVDQAYIETLVSNYISTNEIVSNVTITNTLYASMGDIADLTVNRLETSDKADRYKATPQDTSRMDFIRIEGKEFKFIEAVVKMSGETPLTEPLISPNGDTMYWTDETETAMTVEVTDYPVTVFQYDEVEKLKLFYELDSGTGYYVPKMIWGVGAGVEGFPERGRGSITKGDAGFQFSYINEAGTEYALLLGESGIKVLGGSPSGGLVNVYPPGVTITNPQHGDLKIVTA